MAERRIGVAMDFSPSSKKALRWAADNLVRKGDTLVLLHVRHHGRVESKNVLWSHTGSRKRRRGSPASASDRSVHVSMSLLGVIYLLDDDDLDPWQR